MTKKQKQILILAAVAVGGYMLYQRYQDSKA